MYDCILNCVCFLKLQVWDRWGAGLLFYEVPVVCMTAFVLNCVCFHKPQVWDRWAASLLFYEVPYVCMTAFVLNCVCFRKLQVWDRWGAGFPDTLVASARTPLAQMLATPPGEGEKNE